MKRLVAQRLSALVLTIGVLSACKDTPRVLVVTMDEPLSVTAEASPDLELDFTMGETPRELERMGGRLRAQYFDRVKVLWQGMEVFDTRAADVSISLDRGGLVDDVGLWRRAVYAKDAGPLVAAELRDTRVAQGWRDSNGTVPTGAVFDDEHWASCYMGRASNDGRSIPGQGVLWIGRLYRGADSPRLRYNAHIACKLPPRKAMELHVTEWIGRDE